MTVHEDEDGVLSSSRARTSSRSRRRSKNVAKGIDTLNGQKVIERQPAKLWNTVKQADVELSTVNEVLLENENVMFECNHPNGTGCDYTSENVRSVLAHQRAHGAQMLLKKAQQELEERRARQVAGGKKAAATRAANKANGQNGVTVVPEVETVTDESIGVSLDAIEAVAETLEKNIADLDAAVLQLRIDIKRLKLQKTVDPELLEKAQKYDALKGILG